MLNLLISMAELSDNMVKFLNETLGIWYLIIPNAFGVIAIVSKVTEMQLKSRKTILVFAIIASISWVLYFGLQGGFTSSLSCLIIAIQVIIFSLRNKYKWANSLFWLFFFITLQIVMCVLTLKNWYDVLPTIAGIISVFAYYVLDEDKYRILILFYIVLWLVNSTINLYYVSMVSDAMCTVSAIVAIIRYNILKTHKKPKYNKKEK